MKRKRIKESETIKDYDYQLPHLSNKVRLFGKDFADERIVQKFLLTFPDKYEVIISYSENSKDLSSITLAELVKALQAVQQRRLMRNEGSVEGAFQANSQNNESNKRKEKEQEAEAKQ